MKHVSRAPSPTEFSPNPDYDYEIRGVLGYSTSGAAEPGEVLAATAGIRRNDPDAWFAAWHDLAERTFAAATVAAAKAHPVTASDTFLRASTYFGVAVNAVSGLKNSDRLLPTFQRGRQAWESFVDHTVTPVDRVRIPYEGGSLPGYFFRSVPPHSTPAPTLVAVNGSDGSLAGMWGNCILAALKRGYQVLAFDGPGQQSQLFDDHVPFRPDWEHVLTPVFDALIGKDGVDPERIAVYGISQGGYWVPRGLTAEHRFAAAVADPGVVDVSTSWTTHLPKHLVKLLDEGKYDSFDKEMAVGMRFSPETERTWSFRARPYGTKGYAETIEAVRQYTLSTDAAAAITTPLLITEPEGEQFWPGQSQQLAALTPGVSTIVRFTAAEGANEHCQPLARTLTTERVFDWLDERLHPGRG